MAVLQLLSEENLSEDCIKLYVDRLYRVVCVGERPPSLDHPGGLVRTTYVVDWEQLVHLLEEYAGFGEDIVEVSAIGVDEARAMGHAIQPGTRVARA